jgi:hypothetical protein
VRISYPQLIWKPNHWILTESRFQDSLVLPVNQARAMRRPTWWPMLHRIHTPVPWPSRSWLILYIVLRQSQSIDTSAVSMAFACWKANVLVFWASCRTKVKPLQAEFLTKETIWTSELSKRTTFENYCQKEPPASWRHACEATGPASVARGGMSTVINE